jgi:hypothetical protein
MTSASITFVMSEEDEGCVMALSNLRSEVIELRNEGLEKDKILDSLIKNKTKVMLAFVQKMDEYFVAHDEGDACRRCSKLKRWK